tara:strand:+ start:309 stop:920 length:612 start_codon:yes stop_codon:yes gene_type:complete
MFLKSFFPILIIIYFISNITYSNEISANIKKIENYLNSINSISSNFVQINEDGSISKGKFLLKKPGMMFFEYNKPSNIIIIIDKNVITLFNKLFPKTQQKFPLSITPLYKLSKKNINLNDENILKNISNLSKNYTTITLFNPKKPQNGELKLIFSKNPIKLTGWHFLSLSKENIKVNLTNYEENIFISNDKFDYDIIVSKIKK